MAEAVLWRDRAARARARLAAGDLAAARAEAEAVVAGASGSGERGMAHLVLAACCQRSGDAAAALTHARSAVDLVPLDPLAHYALAEQQEKAGDVEGAIASLRRAVEVQPGFAPAQRHLGILLGERGDSEGALAAFEAAVAIDPNHARTWNNLGNAQRSLGRLVDAEQSFVRALALRPDYWLAAANLGQIQRDQGEVVRAEATLRAALARQTAGPPFRPLIVLLAGLLRERGAYDETIALYRQAIELAPAESGSQWFNLAWVHIQRGEVSAAHNAYVRGQKSDPSELRNLLGMHLSLPMIYADHAALRSARDGFAAGIEALSRELPDAWRGLPADQVLDGLRWTNFFLAYQGEDDRQLQARYGALAAHAIDRAAPHWRAPVAARPAGNRRRRVGFASAFFHDGTCGRYFRSWITDLDRDRFEVFVYHLFPGMDNVASAVKGRADCFRTFGGSRARPSIVAPAIRADELDVLVYPELGMDVCSFGLAALRLAPLQFAGWGHPVTTGHAMIDAFISCDSMESAQAQSHYTERLIRLPAIGTRYERLAVPTDATRATFGFPEDRVLLLCPQSLWKIHPDNDALFAEVLTANRDALLLLFSGRHPSVTDQLMRRLERAFAQHGLAIRERVRVLPPVPHEDYLRINLVCDAMLDTLHWSGGNTSLDALACGLPIVTLPGAFMRGRQSAGMLSLLGLPELIARDRADYLAIAARLCGDAAWRHECANRIRAGQHLLFDVPDAIDALQKVLLQEDVPPT
jgi:predicted O-linked N-acetylglucosamine transferase (SPINDLY family)